MAKILFGAGVVDARGKQGGWVYSRNRGGAYMRNKVTPLNPQTSYQAAVRGYFTSLSQGFRSLTQDQIAAWNASVDSFTSTNVFGNSVRPTGKNLYVKLNQNLINAGQSQITDPPAPAEVLNIGNITVAAAAGAGTVAISWSSGAVPSGHTIIVEATIGQSPGVSFVKSKYRVIKTIAAAASSPNAAGSAYTAKFGGMTAGLKLFVRQKAVNNTTGQANQYFSASCIIAA